MREATQVFSGPGSVSYGWVGSLLIRRAFPISTEMDIRR